MSNVTKESERDLQKAHEEKKHNVLINTGIKEKPDEKMQKFSMAVELDDYALHMCARAYLATECQRHMRGTLKEGEEYGKIKLFGNLYNYKQD